MKRPNILNYYTKDPGSNQDAIFINRYIEDVNKYCDLIESENNKLFNKIKAQANTIKKLQLKN